jgi:hypothetical protein
MNDNEVLNPQLAEVKMEPISRSALLLKGAMAAGAVYGLGMVTPFVRNAFASSDTGDVDILNFALTLEYLESSFYQEAKFKAKAGGDLKSLIDQISDDENQHVAALIASIKQLGGTPVVEPKFDFPYKDTAGFLKLAQTFEDTGVSAYNGAAPMISSKAVLGSAGSIVQVEARHAAAIRLQNKTEPAPDAFDPSLTQAQVTKAVQPFIVG